jgi:hypothetical protein
MSTPSSADIAGIIAAMSDSFAKYGELAEQLFVALDESYELYESDENDETEASVAASQAVLISWAKVYGVFNTEWIGVRDRFDTCYKARMNRAEVLGSIEPIRKIREGSADKVKPNPMAELLNLLGD